MWSGLRLHRFSLVFVFVPAQKEEWCTANVVNVLNVVNVDQVNWKYCWYDYYQYAQPPIVCVILIFREKCVTSLCRKCAKQVQKMRKVCVENALRIFIIILIKKGLSKKDFTIKTTLFKKKVCSNLLFRSWHYFFRTSIKSYFYGYPCS